MILTERFQIMSKSIRKVNDIIIDLEKLLFELHEEHELQHGDVLALIHVWQTIHVPESIETYEDGTSPEFYYGEKRRK